MVAPPSCHHPVIDSCIYLGRRFCTCSIYLLYILIMHNGKREKQLETLVVISIIFLIAFFVFEERPILIASIIFSLLCLLSPSVLSIVHKIWSSFFLFLGEINSRILLFIVFFLFLVPIASLKKIFSKR
jgi:hypothetical protein